MSNTAPMLKKFKAMVKSRAPGLVRLLKTDRHPIVSEDLQIIPLYTLTTHPGSYSSYSIGWQSRNEPVTHFNLDSHRKVEFSLQCLHREIHSISLRFGTHNRLNTCRVVIRFDLLGPEASLLAEVSVDARTLKDNEIVSIPVTYAVSTGDWIRVSISSPDANDTNCVALWGMTVPKSYLRLKEGGHANCINTTERMAIVSHSPDAPIKEHFFPRFTASSFPSYTKESVIGWNGRCFAEAYQLVLPDSPTILTFRCNEANLSKVVIRTAALSRTNSCRIKFSLSKWQSGWREVTTHECFATSITDGPYEWKFKTQGDSMSTWYRIEISSPDSTTENSIAVQGTILACDTDAYSLLEKLEDLSPCMVDDVQEIANITPLQDQPFPRFSNLLLPKSQESFRAAILGHSSLEIPYCDQFSASTIESAVLNVQNYSLLLVDTTLSLTKLENILSAARKLCIPIISYGEQATLSPYVDGHTQSIPHELYSFYTETFIRYRATRLPSFSIISILYNKSAEISFFLDSIARQTYPGKLELLLVDDRSPDDSSEKILERIKKEPEIFGPQGRCPIRLIQNEKNIGNCGSRNRALKEAHHDIAIIVDADCLLNSDFISAHASLHSIGDTDVAIGPYNLETNGGDPLEVLSEYERTPGKALRDAELQDKIVPQSFLNCITRNFSIRRAIIKEDLFNELFSYSSSPDSGFGWEDVEMGYRIFKQGARISFTEHAYSIHISHPSSCDEGTKPLRSLKNFGRLIDAHPELPLIADRWIGETFQKIGEWIDSSSLPKNEERARLETLLSKPRSRNAPTKRLRVLTYRWHCPHQYEIYKLPHDFTLLNLPFHDYVGSWEYDQRPFRPNVQFKTLEQINFSDYDVAIVHFDENVLRPENTNDTLGAHWGDTFKWFRENVPLPMVAICHGTPQFRGQYNFAYQESDLGSVLEFERRELVEYLKGIPVVCNSHQAYEEWQFDDARVIWHGFDPMELGPMTIGHGILTLGKAMKERPVYRGYFLAEEVKKHLSPDISLASLKVPRPAFDYRTSTNEYAWAKFKLYVQSIRQHSIYFNPTIRSPMPRSRGEAMMCGLVPVCANNHDVSRFITNGVDGFYSDDPKELADMLTFLYRNPDKCHEMGQKSRLTAAKLFNIERFHSDWSGLLAMLSS